MRNTWITNKQFLAYCRKPRSSPYRCGPLPLGTLCVWVRGTAEHPRCTWIWRFYSKGVEERWGLGPVSGFVSGLSKAKAYAEKVALAYLQTGKDIRKGRLATGSTITDLIPVYLSAKEKRDRAAHEDIVGETSRLRGFEEILGKYNPAELTPNLCADACNRLTYKDSAITYPLETRRR